MGTGVSGRSVRAVGGEDQQFSGLRLSPIAYPEHGVVIPQGWSVDGVKIWGTFFLKVRVWCA
jgi:hypothetical protein